jgi:hypothetical protein
MARWGLVSGNKNSCDFTIFYDHHSLSFIPPPTRFPSLLLREPTVMHTSAPLTEKYSDELVVRCAQFLQNHRDVRFVDRPVALGGGC